MAYRIRSCLVLLVIIGFLHSIEAKNLFKRSLPEEGTKSEKCSSTKTGNLLMDSCGSYCVCDPDGDGTLVFCKEKKCKDGVEPYSPVDDYEVDLKSYSGEHIESCVPGKKVYNGCNWCQCGSDGTPYGCSLMICTHPVYRKKQ